MVRLPPGMRDQIKRAAEESGRSMNSEILDVLREAFPDAPSVEELVDVIDHSLALLREIQANSKSGSIPFNNKFMTVLNRLEATNDELWKTIVNDRPSPVVTLDRPVMEEIAKLCARWDLPSRFLDNLVNGLVQMSLDRIAAGEENVKVWIGEGDSRRMVELEKPIKFDGESGSST